MRTVALLALMVILTGVAGCQKKPRSTDSNGGASGSASADPLMSDYGSSSGAGSSSATTSTPQPIPLLPEPASAGASSGSTTGGGAMGATGGGTYVVKKGDTLTSISRSVYGTPGRVRDILAANPDVKDPNRIKVGQKLTLP